MLEDIATAALETRLAAALFDDSADDADEDAPAPRETRYVGSDDTESDDNDNGAAAPISVQLSRCHYCACGLK